MALGDKKILAIGNYLNDPQLDELLEEVVN